MPYHRAMARRDAPLGVPAAPADSSPAVSAPAASSVPSRAREQARRRVLHSAGFAALIDAAAVVTWLATASVGTLGTFWPRWILLASGIWLAFRAWSELGPGAAQDEARLGRGGSSPPRGG